MKHWLQISLVCATGLILSGCSDPGPVETTAADLPVYGTDPLYHTVYVGSDTDFHHFRWSRGKRSGAYLVPREQISFFETFEVGGRSSFLVRTDDGTLQLLRLGGNSAIQAEPAE